jgi:hypothetical protein
LQLEPAIIDTTNFFRGVSRHGTRDWFEFVRCDLCSIRWVGISAYIRPTPAPFEAAVLKTKGFTPTEYGGRRTPCS